MKFMLFNRRTTVCNNKSVVALCICLCLLSVISICGRYSPPISDVIKRVDPESYQVRILGQLFAYQHPLTAEIQTEFDLKNTPLLFPIVVDGSYCEVDTKQLNAKLDLDGVTVPNNAKFQVLGTDALETKFGKWTIDEFKGKRIDFQLEEIITCYSAKVDEKTAMQIPWPQKSWPEDAAAALQPQMYIESTNESVVKAVEQLTQGNAKKIPPYVLAKELAKWTVGYFQPSGKNLSNDRRGMLDGMEVHGAEFAVKNKRGPMFDAVCLYVAACRASGLPARPVIGLDRAEKDELVAWAEFYLPSAGWISVDLRPLYKGPGRMKSNEQKWPRFGEDKDLNLLIPLTHHFHPPLSVVAAGTKGKPLMWGWSPRPVLSVAEQRMSFNVMKAPVRGVEDKSKRRR